MVRKMPVTLKHAKLMVRNMCYVMKQNKGWSMVWFGVVWCRPGPEAICDFGVTTVCSNLAWEESID